MPRNFGFSAPPDIDHAPVIWVYIVGALSGAVSASIFFLALHAGGAI